jgi:hypothetical protein
MIVRITGLILCLSAFLVPAHLPAEEMRARSILVLDQSEARGPFYCQVFSGLRSAENADTQSHTTLYAENLDLSRFNSAAYVESLGGNFYPPATALTLIAEKANRPIIVAAATFLEPGGVGGFVLVPGLIGTDAATLALRILNGQSPSNIPAEVTGAVKPIFNWQQMRRWDVGDSNLPLGSEIRFREATLWENYRWQSISVAADSGPGIPPDKLNEVFDPFFTTKKQGMGIGLSIARTIVQAHKGRIWAENQAGGGAVFRLSLPLSLS